MEFLLDTHWRWLARLPFFVRVVRRCRRDWVSGSSSHLACATGVRSISTPSWSTLLRRRQCTQRPGLWSRVSALERLFVDYVEKCTQWARPQIATAVVEPYNTVVCVRFLLAHAISPNLHFQSYQPNVTGGMWSPWTFLVLRCQTVFPERVKVAQMLSAQCSLIFGLDSTNLLPKTERIWIMRVASNWLLRNCFACTFNVIEVCERNSLSGFRAHSNISESTASVLIGLVQARHKFAAKSPPTVVVVPL